MYLDHNKILKGIYKLPMAGLQSIQGIEMLILSKCRNINAYYTIISYHVLDELKQSISFIVLNKKITQAALRLERKVIDYLLVSNSTGRYISYADQGLLR